MKSRAAEMPETIPTESGESPPWQHVWLLVLAATALGSAIQVRDGLYDPRGFIGLTLALAAGLSIFLPTSLASVESRAEQPLCGVFGAAIAFNFFQLFTNKYICSQHGVLATRFSYYMLAIALLLAAGVVLLPRANRLMLVLLVIVFCVIGGWIIRSVPQPFMDVWMLQTEGLKAFRAGHNPFAAVFVDVYQRPELYAPGAMRDGLVHQGFPYPPVVFWMDLAGYAVGGDYRWANLAAIALTAILIAFAQPRSRLGPLAGALFLFTPRAFFVLESGWTEPTTIFLFAATIFCACRVRWLMPVFLGLFLCSKQYLIWAVPSVILLAGRPVQWRWLIRTFVIAAFVGCVASLPLILWDVHAFVAANFGVADTAGFRTDALSYLALFANTTGHVPTARFATLIGFTAGVAATALAIRRGLRTPAGYAAVVAFGHLAFFAFYKFAFCNYYYFLIAAMCCALGAMQLTASDSTSFTAVPEGRDFASSSENPAPPGRR